MKAVYRLLTLLSLILLGFGCARAPAQKLCSKADAAMDAKRYDEAISLMTRALELSPNNPAIWTNRGNCYSKTGDLAKAVSDYDKALELALKINGPTDKRLCYIYYNKAYAFDFRNLHAKAIPLYEKVIALDSKYPDAKGNLAWILATTSETRLRNPDQAIALITQEMKGASPKNPELLDTLAAAQAAKGNFEEAMRSQQQAVDLSKGQRNNGEFAERLNLYKQHKTHVIQAVNG